MNSDFDSAPTPQDLRANLNFQTGILGWEELQPHFARGRVLVATTGLDLVEVAAALAEDNRDRVETLLDSQQLHSATDTEAQDWHASRPRFWAVVVAPWVLVQEVPEE